MDNAKSYQLIRFHNRYLFFTGKGGVGKTSITCATAIVLANSGKKVLIVSTDPASILDDVFETKLGSVLVAIPGVNGLFGANLDPELAAHEYREKVVGSYRGILPESVIASIEEQLSGACTVEIEIAAFDEFTKLLNAYQILNNFDKAFEWGNTRNGYWRMRIAQFFIVR
jgi:arsenite-transporting ATPase